MEETKASTTSTTSTTSTKQKSLANKDPTIRQESTVKQVNSEKSNQESPKKRDDFLRVPGYCILRKENFIAANITMKSEQQCILIQYQVGDSAKEIEIPDKILGGLYHVLTSIYYQLNS